MTTILRPAYSITIASQRWTEQALEIDMHLASAPQTEQLVVSFPPYAPLEAAVGDPLTLELDGGEGMLQVYRGTVTEISRGLDTISITSTGALGRLAQYRPATTFENVSCGTVIAGLASDAGIEVGGIEEGVMLAYYAADPSRTAFDHAARVAAWSGALLVSDREGAVSAEVVNAVRADIALSYGREIITLSLEDGAKPNTVTVAGESGASSDSAPEALRPNVDVFGGNRPSGPGLGETWFFEPALRTASAAATAGAAHLRRLSAAQQSGWIKTFLLPQLRPGTVVELRELPHNIGNGPFWLSDVRHRISQTGATTVSQLRKGGDSFDPMALLGSFASSIVGF